VDARVCVAGERGNEEDEEERMRRSTLEFIVHMTVYLLMWIFLYPFLIKLLWNGIISQTFGLATLTYLKSLGILVMTSLLTNPGYLPHLYRIINMLDGE